MHILHIARAKCWLLKIQREPESGGWHTHIKIISGLWCLASSLQFFHHHRYGRLHFGERWRHGDARLLLLIPLTPGWPGTSQPSVVGSLPVFWLCWHCLFSLHTQLPSKQGIRLKAEGGNKNCRDWWCFPSRSVDYWIHGNLRFQ